MHALRQGRVRQSGGDDGDGDARSTPRAGASAPALSAVREPSLRTTHDATNQVLDLKYSDALLALTPERSQCCRRTRPRVLAATTGRAPRARHMRARQSLRDAPNRASRPPPWRLRRAGSPAPSRHLATSRPRTTTARRGVPPAWREPPPAPVRMARTTTRPCRPPTRRARSDDDAARAAVSAGEVRRVLQRLRGARGDDRGVLPHLQRGQGRRLRRGGGAARRRRAPAALA